MVGALGTAGCGAKPQGQGGDGGSGSGSGSGGSTYAIGGTITGLTGTGLVLHNGSEDLPVPAGATSFSFTTKVASGGRLRGERDHRAERAHPDLHGDEWLGNCQPRRYHERGDHLHALMRPAEVHPGAG